ncbi:choice-of-anchor J domain-containing protein [Flavobacterium sp.]|uniref:choice-of-anchor J domain-containing protein n=1 Tax=Flavobacterium sp. TaxID=239 RepID=UPI0039E5A2BE
MKNITFLFAFFFTTVASFAQFSEDFEGGATLPAGWTAINGGDANTWQLIDLSEAEVLTAHSGVNIAGIGYGSTAHDDYLVTPAITVQAGVNDYLTFWGRSRDADYPEIIDVKVSTTGTNAADFTTTLVAGIAPPSGLLFYNYAVDLSGYVGQTIYIGFYSSTTDMFYFDIDDVVNTALPSCQPPTQVAISDITSADAVLSWLGVGLISTYQIEYGPAGFTIGTGTVINATDLGPATLPDLDAATAYDVYIRTDCGGGSFSDWVSVSFTTAALPPANDDCDNATPLTVGFDFASGSYTATNVASTLGSLVPSCQTSIADDVWFTVEVPSDGNLIIETGEVIGSENTDTVIVAYSGTCGSLVAIECDDDDSPEGTFSLLNLAGLTPGATLYIGVFQYQSIFTPAVAGEFQISVYNTTLGTTGFDTRSLGVYPNPVKDEVNIRNSENINTAEIYNMLGQKMMTSEIRSNEGKLNVSSLAQGNYLMKLYTDNGVKVVNLTKQ